MTHETQVEATTDWRTYAEELGFDPNKVQARLGRSLTLDELDELEDLDDIAYEKRTRGEPTITLDEFVRKHGLEHLLQKKRPA